MKIKIKYILLLVLVLGLSSLKAQDVVISYETLNGLNGTHQLKVYMQSTTAQDVEVSAVNLSVAHTGNCLDFEPSSSVFSTAWTSFLEKESEIKNLTKTYHQQSYTKRLQYGNAEPGLPTTQAITVPANTQSKLLVMEIEFKGACVNSLYMENLAENPVNQLGDSQNRSIPYIIERTQPTASPVQWISFTAAPIQPGEVQLDWTTLNETDSDYFEVEKSSDENFFQRTPIDKVNGAGTVVGERNYSLRDNSEMTPVVFYRLKHIDHSGAFTYSQTVMVSFTGVGELPMRLEAFPNPVVDFVTVRIESELEEVLFVTVTDLSGKILSTLKHDFSQSDMKIDMSGYATGIYNIEAKGTTGKGVVTIVKD